MDAISEVNRTAFPIKQPADAAGEYFAIEMPAEAQPEMDDFQLLSENELLMDDEQPPIEAAHVEDMLLGEIPDAEDFEESVRMALAAVGGELLFQMSLENVEDCRHVAAVSLGSGEQRRVALVILPPEGVMRIEPADSSTNPVAGIARSYVGLVEAYKSAA
jgi:hypothetical protein